MELGRLSIRITKNMSACMHVRAFEALFLRTLDERHDNKNGNEHNERLIRADSIAESSP